MPLPTPGAPRSTSRRGLFCPGATAQVALPPLIHEALSFCCAIKSDCCCPCRIERRRAHSANRSSLCVKPHLLLMLGNRCLERLDCLPNSPQSKGRPRTFVRKQLSGSSSSSFSFSALEESFEDESEGGDGTRPAQAHF